MFEHPTLLRAAWAVAGFSLYSWVAPAAETGTANGRSGATAPVVIELFTSQGCSSCPPADRLLSKLGKNEGIIALSFHVDYWNHLGWRDPYSSAEWSARQRRYAQSLQTTVYTPQLIVDGRSDWVGSDERRIRQAIGDRRPSGSAPSILLKLEERPGEVGVEVELEASDLGGRLDLELIVYERSLGESVTRGENAGRQLRHDYVVRSLERRKAQPGLTQATLALDPDWNIDSLGVVALLRHRAGLQIAGAARQPLR